MIRMKMSREERAKQFMPFAALKGYPDALRKKERVVVPKVEISEEYARELDIRMHELAPNEMASVVYYEQGEYVRLTGMVTRIDETARILKIVNTKIRFDDILEVERILPGR